MSKPAANSALRLAAAVLGLLAGACASAGPPALRLPFEDHGACPFECCSYREWTVEEPTVFYRERDVRSPQVFTAGKGEVVTGLTGVVVTQKPGRVVIKRAVMIGGGGGEAPVPVPAGAVLDVLHYEGEGFFKVWYQGRTYIQELTFLREPEESARQETEDFRAESLPEDVWWVQVRNRDGKVGWTDQSDNFGNMDSCG
jgi:hypothetical protein